MTRREILAIRQKIQTVLPQYPSDHYIYGGGVIDISTAVARRCMFWALVRCGMPRWDAMQVMGVASTPHRMKSAYESHEVMKYQALFERMFLGIEPSQTSTSDTRTLDDMESDLFEERHLREPEEPQRWSGVITSGLVAERYTIIEPEPVPEEETF